MSCCARQGRDGGGALALAPLSGGCALPGRDGVSNLQTRRPLSAWAFAGRPLPCDGRPSRACTHRSHSANSVPSAAAPSPQVPTNAPPPLGVLPPASGSGLSPRELSASDMSSSYMGCLPTPGSAGVRARGSQCRAQPSLVSRNAFAQCATRPSALRTTTRKWRRSLWARRGDTSEPEHCGTLGPATRV